MNKRTKSRIIFMVVFAIFAMFDMISTYFALSVNGYSEGNPIGAKLLEFGNIGYLYFYIFLMFMAFIILKSIDFIFWLNEKFANIQLRKDAYSFVCTNVSVYVTVLQLIAIIGNVGIAIK